MKAVQVKVSEVSSGNSFVKTFPNAKRAKDYADFINDYGSQTEVKLVAEVVK